MAHLERARTAALNAIENADTPRSRAKPYTDAMRSVVDALRLETVTRATELPPAVRVELALMLGDEDVALLASYRGITPSEARGILERSKHRGRRLSVSHESLFR